jgi:hypothetical protein
VVVEERDDRHPLPQQPDRLPIRRHLSTAVDDGVVERRGQGIDDLAVPQRAGVRERPVTASSRWTTLSGEGIHAWSGNTQTALCRRRQSPSADIIEFLLRTSTASGTSAGHASRNGSRRSRKAVSAVNFPRLK